MTVDLDKLEITQMKPIILLKYGSMGTSPSWITFRMGKILSLRMWEFIPNKRSRDRGEDRGSWFAVCQTKLSTSDSHVFVCRRLHS